MFCLCVAVAQSAPARGPNFFAARKSWNPRNFLKKRIDLLYNLLYNKRKRKIIIMSFNAYTMAHITKQNRANMLSTWQQLTKNIEWAAYQGYDYYILNPREWQYMDKLNEYGFETIYNDVSHQYVVRWNV